ncbi:MAG: arginase, partial [Alicyclobacillus shizuokensis]|nr:arginase [Alicyclobacillus shizuokensis]
MKEIHIIGVPSDYGQGRRGVDMGPSAIRYAGLKEKLERLGYTVKDLGDVPVPTPETRRIEHEKLKYLSEVISVCEALADKVREVVAADRTPVVLGGDHSIAIGSLAGLATAGKNFGLIWFDAHGDMNTHETTPSGNIHGMPLAASLGLGHPSLTELGGPAPKVKAQHVVLVGARSI